MPKTIPAAGEAMPTLTTNRRRFLLGLAVASTAAALPAVAGEAPRSENPKLVALAARLPAVVEEYYFTTNAYRDFQKRAMLATPLAPDELTIIGAGLPHVVRDLPGGTEVSVLDDPIYRPGEEFPRRIVLTEWLISRDLRESKRCCRLAQKSGSVPDYLVAEDDVKRLEKLKATAQKHEKAFAAVKAKYLVEKDRLHTMRENGRVGLSDHIAAIMAEEDLTMEGLMIKAEALGEWDRIDRFDKMIGNMRHGDWHGKIAASILRHAERGAANV